MADVKMIEVTDLKQLIKLFYAGGGTFFFINAEKKNRKFHLKFKRSARLIDGLHYSDIHVCFNDGLYFHLGRYNFKYQLMQLSDETHGYNYDRLNLFLKSFRWVRDHIVSGKGFPSNIHVFYNGHCCRCGGNLEHPDSLKKGLGPECEVLFGLENPNLQLQTPV